MKKITSPIKIFGGKHYLVKDILRIVDNTDTIVDGFCGGCNIILNSSAREKYAFDLDKDLIITWKFIKSNTYDLIKILKETKYCKESFDSAKDYLVYDNRFDDELKLASNYIIRNRMSRAGLNKDYGWSDRPRRGMPEYISAWLSMIDQLPNVAKACQNINFHNGCCRELLGSLNLLDRNIICYFDPPYIHSSRVSKNIYKYEMKTYNKDVVDPTHELTHEGMWDMIRRAKCKFYVSGYYSKEYEDFGAKVIFKKDIANHSGQGKSKQRRVEIVWSLV